VPSKSTPAGDLFVLGEVLAWLETHGKTYELPRNSLSEELAKIFWYLSDTLRDRHRPEFLLEIFLQLVYVQTHPPQKARGSQSSSPWDQFRSDLVNDPKAALMSLADQYDPPVSTVLRPRWGDQGMPGKALARVCRDLEALPLDEGLDAAISKLIRGTEDRLSGEHTTPPAIRKLFASLLSPLEGSLYDPACGTGLLLAELWSSARDQGVRLYGQDINAASWRLAVLHLAIIDAKFDLGDSPADIFQHDQHSELRADRIALDPPLRMSLKHTERLQADPRWVYGLPPKNSGDLGWMQHLVWHLDDQGLGAMLCPPSALLGGGVEKSIRQNLVESGVLEAVVQLPAGLLSRTTIQLTLLTFNKSRSTSSILFIDARNMGNKVRGNPLDLNDTEIGRLVDAVREWRAGTFKDEPAFSTSATADEILDLDSDLTPAHYIDYLEGQAKIDGKPVLEILDALRSELVHDVANARKSLQAAETTVQRLGKKL